MYVPDFIAFYDEQVEGFVPYSRFSFTHSQAKCFSLFCPGLQIHYYAHLLTFILLLLYTEATNTNRKLPVWAADRKT